MGWGPDLLSFYNDAYRPILGTKPEAMGRPFREVWAEAWAVGRPDRKTGAERRGELSREPAHHRGPPRLPEETWWTFCYSPIRDETGGVGGVLCTVYETTSQVRAERERHAEYERLLSSSSRPRASWPCCGAEPCFRICQRSLSEAIGRKDFLGRTVREAVPNWLVRVSSTSRQVYAAASPSSAMAFR
jgi:hypothetical protein